MPALLERLTGQSFSALINDCAMTQTFVESGEWQKTALHRTRPGGEQAEK